MYNKIINFCNVSIVFPLTISMVLKKGGEHRIVPPKCRHKWFFFSPITLYVITKPSVPVVLPRGFKNKITI